MMFILSFSGHLTLDSGLWTQCELFRHGLDHGFSLGLQECFFPYVPPDSIERSEEFGQVRKQLQPITNRNRSTDSLIDSSVETGSEAGDRNTGHG